MLKPTLHLLKLDQYPIFKQLQIEEALLRKDKRNWCLLNTNSTPAIVLGISGNPTEHINEERFVKNPVPVIRRFSGGGTVFINEETYFTTFICQAEELQTFCNPQSIFKWSEKIYKDVFYDFDFKLKENDYIIGNQKFGGNAQYICKDRFLHHTSFLFDYNSDQMNYLELPQKTPKYREQRQHKDFLCRLNQFYESKDFLRQKIEIALNNSFNVKEMHFQEIEDLLELPHRKATTYVDYPHMN